MRIYTWNVNGIRAALKKGLLEWVRNEDPDILCIQETKAHLQQLPPELRVVGDYSVQYCSGERKGYSGTATWSKPKPRDYRFGFDKDPRFDQEGRIIHSIYDQFHLINIYFPNGGQGPVRLQYKLDFYEACQEYCQELVDQGEKLILCGDVNTAHKEIDLARPKENETVSGFMPIERAWLDRFTDAGYVDVFRKLYPEEVAYSWWSMRTRARDRNIGWRLDYFFVSPNLWDRVVDCRVHDDIMGSDHCPVSLEINLE